MFFKEKGITHDLSDQSHTHTHDCLGMICKSVFNNNNNNNINRGQNNRTHNLNQH